MCSGSAGAIPEGVTVGVVEVVAVVVHVAKYLAVVAVPPSVRMHRVDLVETAGV